MEKFWDGAFRIAGVFLAAFAIALLILPRQSKWRVLAVVGLFLSAIMMALASWKAKKKENDEVFDIPNFHDDIAPHHIDSHD